MRTDQQPESNLYDLSSPFLLAPGGMRLIEIHPTQRCNLRCAHCYSESGPDKRGEIALEGLQGFLADARDLGYRYIGISGGEPLLWGSLETFLDSAIDMGYSTSVTTNGTLLNESNTSRLCGRVGIVAVSVDGPPEAHAAIRGSEAVFAAMQRGLSVLRDANVPFSLSFTLTRYNADQLDWLYQFADENGAIGINVHPLCDHGAASLNLSDAIPDSQEFQVASWLLAILMEERGPGGPAVTIDVAKRRYVEQSHWHLCMNDGEWSGSAPFSELVPSLVVEPDGCIVPFIYGFPRSWSIGYIDQESLSDLADAWQAAHTDSIATLVRSTLGRLATKKADYVDLFGEMLATTSEVSIEN